MTDKEFSDLVSRARLLIERDDDGIADMLEEESPDAAPYEILEAIDEAERQLGSRT